MDFFKQIIGRLIAAPIGAAVGFLVGSGIIPADAGAQWEAAVVGAVSLAAYGIVHKLIEKIGIGGS